MEYDIKIKKGIGDIQFNMPVEEVVAILGEAEKVETIDNAYDEITTLLHYKDDELLLFFEGEAPTLQCIHTALEDSTLFGEEVFDLNEKQIVQLMVNNGYVEQDADQEDWGERRISFGQGNVDFYLEDDELLAVVFGA